MRPTEGQGLPRGGLRATVALWGRLSTGGGKCAGEGEARFLLSVENVPPVTPNIRTENNLFLPRMNLQPFTKLLYKHGCGQSTPEPPRSLWGGFCETQLQAFCSLMGWGVYSRLLHLPAGLSSEALDVLRPDPARPAPFRPVLCSVGQPGCRCCSPSTLTNARPRVHPEALQEQQEFPRWLQRRSQNQIPIHKICLSTRNRGS